MVALPFLYILTSPTTSNFPLGAVEPIPKLPLESIDTTWVPLSGSELLAEETQNPRVPVYVDSVLRAQLRLPTLSVEQ